MAAPVSIQLYTLREEAARDFPAVLQTVAEIGYVGVEFAGLHGHSPAVIRKIVDDLGLQVSSSHTALPTAETIAQIEDTEKTLGNTRLVAGFGPDQFKTKEECQKTAEQFQAAALLAKAHGLTFSMHNHWWEFNTIDGQFAYDRVLEAAPDLFSELDVYWAAYGGSDPAAVVARHKARLPLLHIKDGNLQKEEAMLAVGSGRIDFPAIAAAADPDVLQWMIVELDRCETDMTEAVRQSYHYLTRNGLAFGNK